MVESLHQAVEKVKDALLEKVNQISDPFSHLTKDIDEITNTLKEKSEIWKHKQDAKMTEKGDAIHQLG